MGDVQDLDENAERVGGEEAEQGGGDEQLDEGEGAAGPEGAAAPGAGSGDGKLCLVVWSQQRLGTTARMVRSELRKDLVRPPSRH